MRDRRSSPLVLFVLCLMALTGGQASGDSSHGESKWLPVGDGRVSNAPERGSVYACQTRFGGGGAHRTGQWIRNGYWNPSLKPTVDGQVVWPNAEISFSLEGGERVVRGNSLPTHPTGEFPVRASDDAYSYDRNPNRIAEKVVLLRLPAVPALADRKTCVPMGMIGVTITGAAMFNALDAMGRDAAAHEILDGCDGHPERSGAYHYHGPSRCVVSANGPIGYALDGFGIFGTTGESGRALTNADLDDCHGHVAEVRWNGERRSIYHYHLTEEYPYSIGCFAGTPITFRQGPFDRQGPVDRQSPSGGKPEAGRQPTQGVRPGGFTGAGGRPDPLSAVAQELGIDVGALRRAVGPPPPDIDRASRMLGIDRERLRQAFDRHRPR